MQPETKYLPNTARHGAVPAKKHIGAVQIGRRTEPWVVTQGHSSATCRSHHLYEVEAGSMIGLVSMVSQRNIYRAADRWLHMLAVNSRHRRTMRNRHRP